MRSPQTIGEPLLLPGSATRQRMFLSGPHSSGRLASVETERPSPRKPGQLSAAAGDDAVEIQTAASTEAPTKRGPTRRRFISKDMATPFLAPAELKHFFPKTVPILYPIPSDTEH